LLPHGRDEGLGATGGEGSGNQGCMRAEADVIAAINLPTSKSESIDHDRWYTDARLPQGGAERKKAEGKGGEERTTDNATKEKVWSNAKAPSVLLQSPLRKIAKEKQTDLA